MKRRWGLLVCLGAFATALTACGGGSSVADRSPGASGSAPAPSSTTLAPLFATTTTAPVVGPTPGPPASAIPPVTTEPATTTTTAPPTTTTAPPSTTSTTAAPTTTTAPPTTTTVVPPAPSPAPPAATAPATNPQTWVVKAGESFWSVAASVAQSRLGRSPTNAEIAPLWQALIDANQAQLPHPGNPNLIYIGTTLVIPP